MMLIHSIHNSLDELIDLLKSIVDQLTMPNNVAELSNATIGRTYQTYYGNVSMS